MQAMRFGRALNRIVTELRLRDILDALERFFDPNSQNFSVTQEAKRKIAEIVFDIEVASVDLRNDPDIASVLKAVKLDLILDRQVRTNLLSFFEGLGTKDQLLGNSV